MKTTLVPELMMASLLAGFTAPAVAADLPVSLNIQIGIPPIQIGIPPVVLSVPPSMIWVPSLGAYGHQDIPHGSIDATPRNAVSNQ